MCIYVHVNVLENQRGYTQNSCTNTILLLVPMLPKQFMIFFPLTLYFSSNLSIKQGLFW